jgi:hypothetical protein
LLNKYAISFVALMNLHALTEGINKNINILKLNEE